MSKKSVQAVTMFQDGFNCSQSVLATFCEDYGIEKTQAFKLACGLGGGFRCGEVCGAVSGAVLVIGLKYGHSIATDAESKKNCYAKTVEFTTIFKERYGSIICKELLGNDISTEQGYQLAFEQGLFGTTCVTMISKAVDLLVELGY